VRFAVKFLGCKVSQADAMLARRALLQAGHEEAPEELADVHVINTCCITSAAEAKSRQSVRRSLKRGPREVLVSGCAVNLSAPTFGEIDPRVRTFVGIAEEVAEQIAAAARAGAARPGAAAAPGAAAVAGACADLEHDVGPLRGLARSPGGEHRRARGQAPGAETRTRGFLKVQDGCDCSCAYCIIPTVRGGARSRPASGVLGEARRRVAGGQPELVMTGISVGDYRDPERGLELGELMAEVARLPGVERVRLSSVEVIHVRDSLLEALTGEPNVCPHLHVPLQSGDNGVLEAMGRHYTAEQYLDTIATLRAAVPQVNVTTDVIVGFPTEDEAAFERTLELIDAAGITRVHVFPYSPRPGTVAEALGDRVAPEEKKRRARELSGRSEVRSRHHRAAKLGGRERVLVDKLADTQVSGYTEDYTRCYLPPGAGARGELVEVVCEEIQADGIRCRPAGPAP